MTSLSRSRLSSLLNRGGLAVIPTDTLYGVVALALDKEAIGRLYALRRRDRRKPFVLLIPNMEALAAFGVLLTAAKKRLLRRLWPGQVSVIFSVPAVRFSYLHRGTRSLAFRVPKPRSLRHLLARTGALAAPSANPPGRAPAGTLAEAKRYFGDKVDMYVGAHRQLCGKPSTLISLISARPKIVRAGAAPIELSDLWKRVNER